MVGTKEVGTDVLRRPIEPIRALSIGEVVKVEGGKRKIVEALVKFLGVPKNEAAFSVRVGLF